MTHTYRALGIAAMAIMLTGCFRDEVQSPATVERALPLEPTITPYSIPIVTEVERAQSCFILRFAAEQYEEGKNGKDFIFLEVQDNRGVHFEAWEIDQENVGAPAQKAFEDDITSSTREGDYIWWSDSELALSRPEYSAFLDKQRMAVDIAFTTEIEGRPRGARIEC